MIKVKKKKKSKNYFPGKKKENNITFPLETQFNTIRQLAQLEGQ